MSRVVTSLIILLVILSSCSSDPAPDLPPADEVLNSAAERMGRVEGAHFDLTRQGAAIYIDPDELLAFAAAEGRYSAPDKADALVTVKVLGISTQIGAVQIASSTWLTNPITGDWEPAPTNFTLDVAALFDGEKGIRKLLATGVTDVTMVGEETIENERLFHLTAVAPADQVANITAGMVAGQAVQADIWIVPETWELRVLSFDTSSGEGVSTWNIRLDEYGQPVTIAPPDTDS